MVDDALRVRQFPSRAARRTKGAQKKPRLRSPAPPDRKTVQKPQNVYSARVAEPAHAQPRKKIPSRCHPSSGPSPRVRSLERRHGARAAPQAALFVCDSSHDLEPVRSRTPAEFSTR